MENNPFLEYLRFHISVSASLSDSGLSTVRHELAEFTVEQFRQAAHDLTATESNGDQAQINKAVTILLEIGAALISGANDLFMSGNTYAAAALVRQLVEIEYLAWAFEDNEAEAKKWITSDKEERMNFFSPAKLRKAAQGRFRAKDYGYHCELGGHPVPEAGALLESPKERTQLLLSDMLGHSGRIWDHLVLWAGRDEKKQAILSRHDEMLKRYVSWKQLDISTRLPPPP